MTFVDTLHYKQAIIQEKAVEILNYRDVIVTVLDHPDLPLTNNEAKRTLSLMKTCISSNFVDTYAGRSREQDAQVIRACSLGCDHD